MPIERKSIAILRLAVLPALALAALLLAWKAGYFDLDGRRQLLETAHRLRGLRWMEGAYVIAYTLAIVLVLPATVATIVGGALFGAWKGAALAWAGALVGTLATHLLARYVARAPMRRLFGEHRMLKVLRDHDDVLGLLRLRVLPVAPFAVLDYAAGVAGVSISRLLLATAVGTLPSVVAYAYVGSETIRGLARQSAASHRALWVAGGITAVMLLVSLIPHVFRKLRP